MAPASSVRATPPTSGPDNPLSGVMASEPPPPTFPPSPSRPPQALFRATPSGCRWADSKIHGRGATDLRIVDRADTSGTPTATSTSNSGWATGGHPRSRRPPFDDHVTSGAPGGQLQPDERGRDPAVELLCEIPAGSTGPADGVRHRGDDAPDAPRSLRVTGARASSVRASTRCRFTR